ncbi:MAG TPA: ATP-binding protein, partial [Pseudomonadales bacterium]|nr:ATP-binding protein [Pseudomonadales bacterium]
FRRNGAAEGGSGLGLAIVKAIASRHGATVTLGDSPLGGLRVTVAFPGDATTLGS